MVNQKNSEQVDKGDILGVVLPSASFKPVVLVSLLWHLVCIRWVSLVDEEGEIGQSNAPEVFSWRGSIPFLFTGEHSFSFRPSTDSSNPGGTTFIHAEEFQGLMSFLVGPTWVMGKQTRANYEAFNEELKGRVEGMQGPA